MEDKKEEGCETCRERECNGVFMPMEVLLDEMLLNNEKIIYSILLNDPSTIIDLCEYISFTNYDGVKRICESLIKKNYAWKCNDVFKKKEMIYFPFSREDIEKENAERQRRQSLIEMFNPVNFNKSR